MFAITCAIVIGLHISSSEVLAIPIATRRGGALLEPPVEAAYVEDAAIVLLALCVKDLLMAVRAFA